MSASEEINAKLDWIVEALKYLLQEKAGVPLGDDEDAWLDNDALAGAAWAMPPEVDTGDVLVPIHAPRQQKRPPCPHNRQEVVGGKLACARCGFVFGESGLVQSTVASNGSVIPDRNPPRWVREISRGASSKNPGGQLIPHHVDEG